MESRAFYAVEVAIGTTGSVLAIMLSPIHQIFIIYLTGMAMILALLLWPEKKDKTIPLEAIKFKSLCLQIKRCLEVVEDGDYDERIRAIRSLSSPLEKLDIEIPPLYIGIGAFYGCIRAWKDFLERLVPLAEAEASADNLEIARKIWREELLELPSADKKTSQ